MTIEIKMLKTVNQQRANFFKKHNELRSVIAEECETQAWRDIAKKERDNMTLKQQIDAQIQKRIVAERRFEQLQRLKLPFSITFDEIKLQTSKSVDYSTIQFTKNSLINSFRKCESLSEAAQQVAEELDEREEDKSATWLCYIKPKFVEEALGVKGNKKFVCQFKRGKFDYSVTII